MGHRIICHRQTSSEKRNVARPESLGSGIDRDQRRDTCRDKIENEYQQYQYRGYFISYVTLRSRDHCHINFNSCVILSPFFQPNMSTLAPKTTTYEWMGPIGAFFMMIGLPTVVYALYFVCNPQSCSIGDVSHIELPAPSRWLSVEAIVVVLGWIAFQAIIYAIDVGKVSHSRPPRKGSGRRFRRCFF